MVASELLHALSQIYINKENYKHKSACDECIMMHWIAKSKRVFQLKTSARYLADQKQINVTIFVSLIKNVESHYKKCL